MAITENAEIHPAPAQFTAGQLADDPILQFFHYAHLPPVLQATSARFCTLASHIITTLPRNAERSVALRKLLESKDAAVRANVKPKTGTETMRQRELDKEFPVVEKGGHDLDRDGPPPFGS